MGIEKINSEQLEEINEEIQLISSFCKKRTPEQRKDFFEYLRLSYFFDGDFIPKFNIESRKTIDDGIEWAYNNSQCPTTVITYYPREVEAFLMNYLCNEWYSVRRHQYPNKIIVPFAHDFLNRASIFLPSDSSYTNNEQGKEEDEIFDTLFGFRTISKSMIEKGYMQRVMDMFNTFYNDPSMKPAEEEQFATLLRRLNSLISLIQWSHDIRIMESNESVVATKLSPHFLKDNHEEAKERIKKIRKRGQLDSEDLNENLYVIMNK